MTLKENCGVHVRWPQMAPIHTWWQEMSAQEQMQSRDKALVEIREAFADARDYYRHQQVRKNGAGRLHDFDARWEAFVPVFEGRVPLVVDAAGRKLSKSLAGLAVDADDPLTALRAAWVVLGQATDALAGIADRDGWLAAAVRAFDPARIPRGPVAASAALQHDRRGTQPRIDGTPRTDQDRNAP